MNQVAPGVERLFGMPPNAINVYLADDVLIDAATKLASRRILRQILDRPVSMVALTHVHPDHQGAAKAVCEARGIPLGCHVADIDAMEGRVPIPSSQPDHPLNRLISWGFEGPPYQVRRPFEDGDQVGSFRVIHAPGHSPSEVIFFRDSDRVAICGDVINTMDLRTALPRVQEPPQAFSFDPMANRDSIRKLLELQPSVVLPGHGPPLRDLAKLEALVASF